MCLITKQKRVKIAKEDIKCYKNLAETADSNTVRSIHYDFTWAMGKVEKTKLKRVFQKIIGADTVATDKYDVSRPDEEILKEFTAIGPGFHACLTIKRARQNANGGTYQFEAIIPKGSRYYMDSTGLIVADQMMIKGMVS
jgi:hypothetical protein